MTAEVQDKFASHQIGEKSIPAADTTHVSDRRLIGGPDILPNFSGDSTTPPPGCRARLPG